MNQEELRKLMECYRPGPEGLGDAEFSALRAAAAEDSAVREQLEAVQAWDAVISQAMHDVPVPAGLADRLLEQVAGDSGPGTESDEASTSRFSRKRHRRWWNRMPARVTAAAVSLAALVMVVFYLAGFNDTLSSAQVAQSARSWSSELDEAGWQQSVPPGDEYLHPALVFPLDGWQRFTKMHDSEAVAYRATVLPARSRAILYVIKTRQGRLLPTRPPRVPDSTTGGICIGVWKSDGHLYVLAVHGTRRTYGRLLRTHAIARLERPSGRFGA